MYREERLFLLLCPMKQVSALYHTYKEISFLTKLQNKRHPSFYKRQAMKVVMICMQIFMICYLFFIGLSLKDILQAVRQGMEPYNLFNEGMVFLLVLDMAFRFMGQETPAIKAHPFLLLPVPRKLITDCFLIKILLMPANLIWMALLLPFAAKAVFPFYGVSGCIGYLAGWWLAILMNCYFYLLVRTLVMKRIWWLVLPFAVYSCLLVPVFLPGVDFMGYFFMYLGEGWMKGHLWSYLLVIILIGLLFVINRKLQTEAVYTETAGASAQSEAVTPRVRINFGLFDRFGITGEFLKMEVKSVVRNKTVRSRTTMLMGVTILFSLILSLSPDVYGETGNAFWCFYCFVMPTTALLHTLGTEGNYMDGLMVHRQLLTDLLRGKYYFYCILELIPLILMLPAAITGAVTFAHWASYYLIAIGFCLPVTLQTAAFTNYCEPLNRKMTSLNSSENIAMSFLWMGIILIVPMGIQYLLTWLISSTAAYTALCLIGIAGFLTNPLWIDLLYKRIYKRRYRNMEGFRSSRNA